MFDYLILLAADYSNEPQVWEAPAEAFWTGLVKREEHFITTKSGLILQLRLWNSDDGHVIEACKDCLNKLHLDYLAL
ncbi:Aldo/keto reductase/potassium channel subunit beta [Parasponia andersonii]|uniref:Aldo/keto reductase/potassium channel subunit beta n=1 Tax=Parasponia andersonii TaxID=3476 RepID=A0A2P5AKB6_PARAD|nr:Aldo/keto reductase/potassium channel subunit beta [Parasponia andersonii]